MPQPRSLLRLIAFMVPAGLAMSAVQPLVSAAAGDVELRWAMGIAAPALGGAGLIYLAGRLFDRRDGTQPPWYAAWMLLPGAFLIAGAASMCIFGALVELWLIVWAMWALLVVGAVLWSGALVLVRTASR